MEKDRGFRFKLLVPPRVTHSQVNAVRPQEKVENYGDLLGKVQRVSSALNQNNPSAGELYSKLFDEVDKIKSWKVKVETETVEKERKLQDNKKTIETQRKAIQELQFGNESLSIKLEEQICENEDLRNKNSATRSLCNILKETCQRSSERMHLFESEREETHRLFMENSESIKKLLLSFESLRIQVEADQREMQKVKEDVMQLEDLKEEHHQERMMKDKELEMLQKNIEDKENELQKTLINLNESQKNCQQLQDSTRQQSELLQSLKTEKECLLQSLNSAEQRCEEIKKKQENTVAALEKSKKEYEEIIQNKDTKMQDLIRVKIQQAEKLEQTEATVKELKNSYALEIERAKDLQDKLMKVSSELGENNKLLGESIDEAAKKDDLIKTLVEELENKSRSTGLLKSKMDALEAKADELVSELSRKAEEIQILTNEKEMAVAENSLLKEVCGNAEKAEEVLQEKFTFTEIKVKELEMELCNELKKNKEYSSTIEKLKEDILQHKLKYQELSSSFDKLQRESKDLTTLKDEDCQKMLKDLESKSLVMAELEKEVQKLKLTTADAIKSKEDAELKCQNKITEMVALMEKHKNQYDRMVEEKDTELDKNKKKEMEAVARAKSLELDLSKQKIENEQLKKQLKTKETDKENLQKEVTDLKKEMSAGKITQSQARKKQSKALNSEQQIGLDTPEKSSLKTYSFDFSKTKKTPSNINKSLADIGKAVSAAKITKTSSGTTAKTKSYRVRTPPSNEKAGWWGTSAIELDSKSDSSDHIDLFICTNEPEASDPVLLPRCNIFKKMQSPITLKSPGNSLKLAAMKRMRDAGWTAVTGCDKKKKTSEKIFA